MERMSHADSREELPTGVLYSFVAMAVFFSINHGTVTAVIPLATSEFDDTLGDYSLGALYLFYTLTALLASTVIVERFGHKWSLVAGLLVYSVYVVGTLLGVLTHHAARSVIVIVSSSIGGVAAGFLWTAQGGYYATAAKLYAKEKNITTEEATSFLGGIFATVYLSFELIMKLLSSLILVWVCGSSWHGDILTGKCRDADTPEPSGVPSPFDAPVDVFADGSGSESQHVRDLKFHGVLWTYGVFSVLAVVSAIGMAFVKQLRLPQPLLEKKTPVTSGEGEAPKRKFYHKLLVATDLMRREPKILLLGFFNIQFGLTAAYLNSYVTGTVIKEGLGKDKVGYFVSIIPLVATFMSMPLSKATSYFGTKTPSVLLGMFCFATFGLVFFITDLGLSSGDSLADKLGDWGPLAPLFIVFGTGRAVWEGPNKAVFADMFKAEPEAAFANLILQLGLTSTFSFLFLHFLPSKAKEGLVVGSAVLAIVGYLVAINIDKKQRAARAGADVQEEA